MQESYVFDDEGETAAAAAESVQSVLRKENAAVKAKTCLTSANKRLQMLETKLLEATENAKKGTPKTAQKRTDAKRRVDLQQQLD